MKCSCCRSEMPWEGSYVIKRVKDGREVPEAVLCRPCGDKMRRRLTWPPEPIREEKEERKVNVMKQPVWPADWVDVR